MLIIEAMCVHHALMMIMRTNMGMYRCLLDTIACSRSGMRLVDQRVIH